MDNYFPGQILTKTDTLGKFRRHVVLAQVDTHNCVIAAPIMDYEKCFDKSVCLDSSHHPSITKASAVVFDQTRIHLLGSMHTFQNHPPPLSDELVEQIHQAALSPNSKLSMGFYKILKAALDPDELGDPV